GNQAVGLLDEVPNRDIKWETTDEFDIGIDFGIISYRITGSIDYYNRITRRALTTSVFPLESGGSSYTANFADLSNKGFEIELGADLIQKKNFSWSININLSHNENTLEKFLNEFGGLSFLLDSYREGYPVNLIKGYAVAGIFQDQAE